MDRLYLLNSESLTLWKGQTTIRRMMESTDHNDIHVDEKGIITIAARGLQTRESTQQVLRQLKELITSQKAKGKKIFILTDISDLRMRDVTSGARQEARSVMGKLPVDRVAVYGHSKWATFMMYLLKVTGMGNKVRFFTTKHRARSWLGSHRSVKAHRPLTSLIAGIIIGLIGIATLIGWQFDNSYLLRWIPSFRPMNPMAAVGLLVIGLGFIGYWAKQVKWLRWSGVSGVLLGSIALLPLDIDHLLYGSAVMAAGGHVQLADSAAVCFIAMGVVALIAGRNGRWVQPIEYMAALIIGGVASLNVFGQLYAYDWIYGLSDSFVMAFNLAVAFVIAVVALVLLVLYRRLKINVLSRITRTGWLIVIVLLLVQAATYGSWVQAVNQNKASASSAFMTEAKNIQTVLDERFSAYINALYGFQGLYLASSEVNQKEFETYYNSTNIAVQYPGLRTFSFVSKVANKDLAAFVQKQRQDRSLHPEGNPGFTITQQSNGPDHYIFTYAISSFTVGGLDLSSNPSRAEAFSLADATQKPATTGPIQFAATPTEPAQSGFFITVPVAYGDDPKKTVGFVNAVFNYSGFFADTFKDSVTKDDLNIKVVDAQSGEAVFNSQGAAGQKEALFYEVPIQVANSTWNLKVGASEGFGVGQSNLPGAVLMAGQVFSLLLIIIFFIQTRARQQALRLASDITQDLEEERNRAVANDQKSTAILSSIGDGVFAIDTKGRVAVFNLAAQEISGVSEEYALGKPYQEVLRFEFEKSQKVNDAFIKKALAGHLASMTDHTVLIRRDGKRVPVADSAAPIRDASGTLIGAIVVFRDVSKEYELDKAKSEFVSLASHQLRTPLSAINWYGEMLLNGDAGKLNKDQLEYIREIFEGSQRMVELVNSLLDVSRLEVGKLANKPAPVNIAEVIESLEKELHVSIKTKKLSFTKQIEAIPAAMVDPKQLRMVVQNLMSNAVKYTNEKGAVEVTLRKATEKEVAKVRLKPTREYWLLSVKDNGYGIPKEEQPKIFGKLFRADNVRKLDVEGTGLGLYIVKQVVEKMGGSVWFESVEGEGTTFTVIAPVEVKR